MRRMNSMLVVTMTSWTKRIGNVKRVVESIMDNTVKPDRVYLNLSRTEFEGIKLPKDLVEYFENDERLVINWVDGENTKSMKKVFPILKYLDDDDLIIDADDDILFPKDLIESRINDFEKCGCCKCISSNTHISIGFNSKMKVVSAMSFFQKKMLNNWEKFVNDVVIHTYNDDRTYLTLMWLNGYLNKGCSKWSVQELLEKFGMKDNFSMKDNHIHLIGRRYDMVVNEDFKKRTGRNIIDSFGYYQNNKDK
jgi:hypothetical protein